MIIISASMLRDYLSCKAKAWYRRTKVPRATTASMILGQNVHDMVADYEDGRDISGYDAMLVERLSGDVVFYRGQSFNSLMRQKENCFNMYKQLQSQLPPIIHVEEQFQFHYEPDVKVVGRFDQIRQSYVIAELKTGYKEPSEAMLKADIQTDFYMWAYQNLNHQTPTYYYIHLPSGTIYEQKRNAFYDIEIYINKFIKDARAGNFPKEKDGYKCSGCSYKDFCLKDEPSSSLIYKVPELPKLRRARHVNRFIDV